MVVSLQALYDGSVDYEDGTPNTASQAAKVCRLLSSQYFAVHCLLLVSTSCLLPLPSGCIDIPRLVL